MENNEEILKKLEGLISKTDSLKGELNELKKILSTEPKPPVKEEIKPPPKQVIFPTPVKEVVPPGQEPVVKPPVQPPVTVQPPTPKPQPQPVQPVAPPPKKAQDNRVEKYIGENLINKIGIGVLVIGIGFFVKYAIDKQWINEAARVLIGVLCGLALIGVAYKMRKRYKAFSSVLIGGGISVLYFTFTLAYREYALISQPVAFIIMILITAFTVFLSLSFDRKEIAIIAIIGGFASPLLLSTGTGNYIVLFTYLLILNIGMLVLAYFKHWNIINFVCFIATLIFYGSWLGVNVLTRHKDPYLGAFIFASCFYAVFFIMNIINSFREEKKSGVFEIIILVSNTFFYYLAGMLILQRVNSYDLQGIFTACMAVFHLAASFFLFKNKKVDNVFAYLMIGFALSFISLFAPVQLHGNFITVFWAAEVALLFWMSQVSNIKMLKYFSAGILILVCSWLIRDWYTIYVANYFLYPATPALPVVFNKGFFTAFFSTASVFVTMKLIGREDANSTIMGIPKNIYRALHLGLFVILLYVTINVELKYQLNRYFDQGAIRQIVGYSYNALFFLCLLYYLKKYALQGFVIAFSILCLIITLVYPLGSHFNNVSLRDAYLESGSPVGYFIYHYLNIVLITAILFLIYSIIKTRAGLHSVLMNIYYWLMAFIFIFIATSELDHIALLSFYDPDRCTCIIFNNTIRIGYPVLWGIASFIIMVIGMNKKIRMLRIISLSVFFITLVKLFTYDIVNISAAGKIIAFILLGILLLTISFLYQKLKKILFEEHEKTDEDHEINQQSS